MSPVRPTRRRRRALGAAVALVLAAGFVSSCGGDSNTGLSQQRASNLRSSLDQVETRVNDRDCTGAPDHPPTFRRQVDSLPSRVDRDLRNALERSATRLETLVADQCEPAAAVEEPQTQAPTTTDETGGDQQGNGKKDKKPKKPKDDQPPDTGVTGPGGSTGTTGTTGATGVTGDGGAVVPGGGE
jgi:hypothetical protein